MSKAKVTGVSTPIGGLAWQYVATNSDLARRIVVFLSDRRVLFESTMREDFEDCRASVDDIRKFLTLELMNVKGGGRLEEILTDMRRASRAFVSTAGKNSERFCQSPGLFAASLIALREAIGTQLADLASAFTIAVPDELRELLPKQDLSWLPGTFENSDESEIEDGS